MRTADLWSCYNWDHYPVDPDACNLSGNCVSTTTGSASEGWTYCYQRKYNADGTWTAATASTVSCTDTKSAKKCAKLQSKGLCVASEKCPKKKKKCKKARKKCKSTCGTC
jgi:hypothetical protein